MRPKFFTTAGSCRCDANRPKRPSNTLGGPRGARPGEQRRGHARSAPRTRSAGTSICVPSTQHSSSPAAVLPAMPAAHASALRVEPEQLAGRVGDAERREETGRMKAAAVELPGDTDCRRGTRSRCRSRSPESDRGRSRVASRRARARRPPRGCSCARSTRCACRRTRAPARTTRWRTPQSAPPCGRRCPRSRLGPAATSPAPRRRVERPNGSSAPASARPITSSMRSFVVSTTSAGRSSKVRPATQAATSLASAASRPETGRWLTTLISGLEACLQRPGQRATAAQQEAAHAPCCPTENEPVWSRSHPMMVGPTKPPSGADRVDEGQAAGRGHAAQEPRRNRPEDRARGVDAAHRHHDPQTDTQKLSGEDDRAEEPARRDRARQRRGCPPCCAPRSTRPAHTIMPMPADA